MVKHYVHKSKKSAEAQARRLKDKGHSVKVYHDHETGKWIVAVLTLGLAFGIIGAALRPR